MSIRWSRRRHCCRDRTHVRYYCPHCGRDLYHSARTVIDPDETGLVAAFCQCGTKSIWDFDKFPTPIRVHP